jgi:hypothetical protein
VLAPVSDGYIVIQSMKNITVKLFVNSKSSFMEYLLVSSNGEPVVSVGCGNSDVAPWTLASQLPPSVHVLGTERESYVVVGSRSYSVLHRNFSYPNGSSVPYFIFLLHRKTMRLTLHTNF